MMDFPCNPANFSDLSEYLCRFNLLDRGRGYAVFHQSCYLINPPIQLLASPSTRRHHMANYEKLYDQFQLTTEQRESLLHLASPPLHIPPKMDRLIVETVIVEGGERRIIKKEELGAKLV